jgi:hypothetical protein
MLLRGNGHNDFLLGKLRLPKLMNDLPKSNTTPKSGVFHVFKTLGRP